MGVKPRSFRGYWLVFPYTQGSNCTFFRHLTILKEHAKRVIVWGNPLAPEGEQDRTDRIQEFLTIGLPFDSTGKEMVTILYLQLFSVAQALRTTRPGATITCTAHIQDSSDRLVDTLYNRVTMAGQNFRRQRSLRSQLRHPTSKNSFPLAIEPQRLYSVDSCDILY